MMIAKHCSKIPPLLVFHAFADAAYKMKNAYNAGYFVLLFLMILAASNEFYYTRNIVKVSTLDDERCFYHTLVPRRRQPWPRCLIFISFVTVEARPRPSSFSFIMRIAAYHFHDFLFSFSSVFSHAPRSRCIRWYSRYQLRHWGARLNDIHFDLLFISLHTKNYCINSLL